MLKSAICHNKWYLTKIFLFSGIIVDSNFQKFQTVNKSGPKFWRNAYLTKLMAHCTLYGLISIPTQNGSQNINGFSNICAANRGQNFNQSINQSINKTQNSIFFYYYYNLTHFLSNKLKRHLRTSLFQKKVPKGLCHLKV